MRHIYSLKKEDLLDRLAGGPGEYPIGAGKEPELKVA